MRTEEWGLVKNYLLLFRPIVLETTGLGSLGSASQKMSQRYIFIDLLAVDNTPL